MINGEKIGVGIVTMGRENLFKKLFSSLQKCEIIDKLYITEDSKYDLRGEQTNEFSYVKKYLPMWEGDIDGTVYNVNVGVGKSKNKCLQNLLDYGCDHIFLIEDDMLIKDSLIFEKYIEASKVSGIQHFNYSQHGLGNVTHDFYKNPNPNLVVDYKTCKIALYTHCVGAFSYYSRKCLETVGLIDERYYNACEHVDHTYEIIKAGMHPPYWYFADIDNSWEYLGDEEWSREKSTISSNPNHHQMMKDADIIFREKHGCVPVDIKLLDFDKVGKELKRIKQDYGQK
jgi:GT2 family glycosyltransferase